MDTGGIQSLMTYMTSESVPPVLEEKPSLSVTSDVFKTWAPDLYESYKVCHDAYGGHDPALHRISGDLPFAAVTGNMGPRTVCIPHRDAGNLAWGWCVVCALGDFDPTAGGHMVLHEAKVILEFGPSDIIFLPSAIITHENLPVQENEQRYSLTFYSSGELFRLWDCAFRTLKDWPKGDRAGLTAFLDDASRRWEDGCKCFATLEQLATRHRPGPSERQKKVEKKFE